MTDEQLEILLKEATGDDIRFNKGWYLLVKNLYAELEEAGWDRKVTCVKEKYGQLAFYLENRTPYLLAIIQKYQRLSVLTCEYCGMPGRTMDMGWDKTVCPIHYLEWRINLQKDYRNYRNLGNCEICGFVSMLNETCITCNNEQWNAATHGEWWTRQERIKEYQLSWYSYVTGIPDNQISLFPKAENHTLYFNSEELNNYEEITEFND